MSHSLALKMIFVSAGLLVAVYALRDGIVASLPLYSAYPAPDPTRTERLIISVLYDGWATVAISALGLYSIYRWIVTRH